METIFFKIEDQDFFLLLIHRIQRKSKGKIIIACHSVIKNHALCHCYHQYLWCDLCNIANPKIAQFNRLCWPLSFSSCFHSVLSHMDHWSLWDQQQQDPWPQSGQAQSNHCPSQTPNPAYFKWVKNIVTIYIAISSFILYAVTKYLTE